MPQNGQKLVTNHKEFRKRAYFHSEGHKRIGLDTLHRVCKDVVMTTRRLLQIVFGFVVVFPALFVYFLLAEPAGFVFDRTIRKWS
jgi:hypothetical protein